MLWTDILPNLIGAFAGFRLAIILQAVTAWKLRQMKLKKIIKAIGDELKSISLGIQGKSALDYKISTPSWDSCLYSGILLDMIGSRKYNSYYNSYVLVYSHIEAINDCVENGNVAHVAELLPNLFQYIQNTKNIEQ